jgi:hypothetical protein
MKAKLDELVEWRKPTNKIEKKLGFRLQIHFKVISILVSSFLF